MRRTLMLAVMAMVATLSISTGRVAENVEVKTWLSEPGVKLVAVDFYGSWCAPCNAAKPHWEALHRKYGSKGLRIVVVGVRENDHCAATWTPNGSTPVCDEDGAVQENFRVHDLPASFLYSWQGELLAQHATVEEVGKAVEDYLKKELTIYVDDVEMQGDLYRNINQYVPQEIVTRLKASSKFTVVSRRAGQARTLAGAACHAERVVSNAVLYPTVTGDDRGNRRLHLSLVSRETGCELAAAAASFKERGKDGDMDNVLAATGKAVGDLLAQLVTVTKPRSATFGLELRQLGDVPTVTSVDAFDNRGINYKDLDLDFVTLIDRAMLEEEKPERNGMDKAAAWETVVAYIDGHPEHPEHKKYRDQFEGQRQRWIGQHQALVRSGRKLALVWRQWKQDQEKIARINAIQRAVTQRQKDAYAQEFEEVYRPWKSDLAKIEQKTHPQQAFITPWLSFEMKQLPAGTFTMGSPASEPNRDNDETQHQVTLSKGFLIGATEVTQGQWKAVMGSTPSYFKNCGDECPVEQVSWWDAIEFCNKLSAAEGLTACYARSGDSVTVTWNKSCTGYRLPTEAEWEYAARGGTTTAFHTGQCLSTDQANYDGNYPQEGCSKGQYRQTPVKVGSFAPKAWGLYDMAGNVWEWAWDWKDAYPTGSVTDPTGPASGSSRVCRGGGWGNSARVCRSVSRGSSSPGGRHRSIGFRLARSRP